MELARLETPTIPTQAATEAAWELKKKDPKAYFTYLAAHPEALDPF